MFIPTTRILSVMALSTALISAAAYADVRAGKALIENLRCTGETAYGTVVTLVSTHDGSIINSIVLSERQYGQGRMQETFRGYSTVVATDTVREITLARPLADLTDGRLTLLRAPISGQFNRMSGERAKLAETVTFSGTPGLGGLNSHIVIHSHSAADLDEGQQIQLNCRF